MFSSFPYLSSAGRRHRLYLSSGLGILRFKEKKYPTTKNDFVISKFSLFFLRLTIYCKVVTNTWTWRSTTGRCTSFWTTRIKSRSGENEWLRFSGIRVVFIFKTDEFSDDYEVTTRDIPYSRRVTENQKKNHFRTRSFKIEFNDMGGQRSELVSLTPKLDASNILYVICYICHRLSLHRIHSLSRKLDEKYRWWQWSSDGKRGKSHWSL